MPDTPQHESGRIHVSLSRSTLHLMTFGTIGVLSVIGLIMLLSALRSSPVPHDAASAKPQSESPATVKATTDAAPPVIVLAPPVDKSAVNRQPPPALKDSRQDPVLVQHPAPTDPPPVASPSPALLMYAEWEKEDIGRREAHAFMAYAAILRGYRILLFKELDKNKPQDLEGWRQFMLFSSTTYAAERAFWQNMLNVFSGSLRPYATEELLRGMADMAMATQAVSDGYRQFHTLMTGIPDKDSAMWLGFVAAAVAIATEDAAPLRQFADAGASLQQRVQHQDKVVVQAVNNLGNCSLRMTNTTLLANATLRTQYIPLVINYDQLSLRQKFDLCKLIFRHVEQLVQNPKELAPESLACLNAYMKLVAGIDSEFIEIPLYAEVRSIVYGKLMAANLLKP